jgi:hypothetical protein
VLCLSSSKKNFVSGSADKTIKIWYAWRKDGGRGDGGRAERMEEKKLGVGL